MVASLVDYPVRCAICGEKGVVTTDQPKLSSYYCEECGTIDAEVTRGKTERKN